MRHFTGLIFLLLVAAGLYAQNVTPLTFAPADSAYSKALERLIMLSSSPNVLHIYDPVTNADTMVALGAAPQHVAISPDGLHAAVAANPNAFYINLQTAAVEATYNVGGPSGSIMLSPTYIYALLQGTTTAVSINLATGQMTVAQNVGGDGTSGKYDAAFDGALGNGVQYDNSTGPITGALPYFSAITITGVELAGSAFWLNGNEIIDSAGDVDYITDGTVPYLTIGELMQSGPIVTLDSSAPGIALISNPAYYYDPNQRLVCPGSLGNDYVQIYNGTTFKQIAYFPLSADSGNCEGPVSQGYAVFYNKAGTELYALYTRANGTLIGNYLAKISTCGIYTLTPSTFNFPAEGGSGAVNVSATAGCTWSAIDSSEPWITTASGSQPVSGGLVTFTVPANTTGTTRSGTLALPSSATAFTPVTIDQSATPAPTRTGWLFVPVTPCRVVDTRFGDGDFSGPVLSGGSTRNFFIPAGNCAIPASAQAFSINATAVPTAHLGYLSIWAAGDTQPLVSTLNSDGRVKAVAAIVPASANTEAGVSVYPSDDTDFILDINGYFVPNTLAEGLAFYPLAPCRVADTRQGKEGGILAAGETRDFSITGNSCNVPANAQAYSLNVTAVPTGILGYLSTWAAGEKQPLASTLNAPPGVVTANAAIVPAGMNGDINVFASHQTHVVIDINGYFAPPGAGALSFYSLAPCRVLDTRANNGAGVSGVTAVALAGSACNVPKAAAFDMNVTVVPKGDLGYLSLWAAGTNQPLVSTLNSSDGTVNSNLAIVPSTDGAISVYTSSQTQVILDIFGYFAP